MKLLITGANGFVASYLMPKLAKEGHELYALIHQHSFAIPDYVTRLSLDDLKGWDIVFNGVINLAGANIGEKRWTQERKNTLFSSRVDFTQELCNSLINKPAIWLNASAVGYYGNDEAKTFTEESTPNSGFTHELCNAWEQVAIDRDFQRTVIFRLGVVLGNGGVLDKMLLPYKLGLGSKIGSGRQYFPWIHIQDVCNFICNALTDQSYQGVYNLVAPETVNQVYFSKTLSKTLGRPHLLWTPACALELAMGEMGTLVTKGQKVLPKRLLERDFTFEYPELNQTLTSIVSAHHGE